MIKYRIIKDNSTYYIQERRWFLWFNITGILGAGRRGPTIYFTSLLNAKKAIKYLKYIPESKIIQEFQ